MNEEMAFSPKTRITEVAEGNLAYTFKIIINSEENYLKLSEKEGSRGNFFMKHLLPVNNDNLRKKAAVRRSHVRKMLTMIRETAPIVPQPLHFDNAPVSADLSYVLINNDMPVDPTGELRIGLELRGEQTPCLLNGLVATYWKGAKLQHFPPLKKENLFDPISYSYASVEKMLRSYSLFQAIAQNYIDRCLFPKELKEQLTHEVRRIKNWKENKFRFLSAFGLDSTLSLEVICQELQNPNSQTASRLRAVAEDRQQTIQQQLIALQKEIGIEGVVSLEELANKFLAAIKAPSIASIEQFPSILFNAEKECAWCPQSILCGKRIAQLLVAEQMTQDILRGHAAQVYELIWGMRQAESSFEALDQLPKSVVLQDAHPFNFMLDESGEVVILDPDDISWDYRVADLANVWISKVIRAYDQSKITQAEASEFFRSCINGFSTHCTFPLSLHEIDHLLDLCVCDLYNHLDQLSQSFCLNTDFLSGLNFYVTMASFIEQQKILRRRLELYRSLLQTVQPELQPAYREKRMATRVVQSKGCTSQLSQELPVHDRYYKLNNEL